VLVAAVQQAHRGDWKSSFLEQRRFAERAAGEGARIVAFPECAATGMATSRAASLEAAQRLDGPYVEAIAALSSSLGVAVVSNLYERGAEADGGVWNTTVVVDGGSLLERYRKVHLFDAQGFRESAVVDPGDPDQVRRAPVRIDDVSVGLLTCFDLRFGEAAVARARAGADLLVILAAWVAGPTKSQQWDVLVRARSIETGCFVAGAAQPGPSFAGRTALVDPYGTVLAGPMGDAEGLIVGAVDRDVAAEARRATPTLADRPCLDAP
jgi:predicted amidohydrolase